MAAREVTQFSVVEYNAFLATNREPKTSREKYMQLLKECLAKPPTPELDAIGGFENLQRVRVIENGEAFKGYFEFVPKLPVAILEQKKREAERERRRQEVIAKARELASDPKKLDEFVNRIVAGIVGRAAAALLLSELKAGRDGKKAAQQRAKVDRGPRKPLSKEDIWKRAQSQDRRNRIEASKAAAQEYHAAHPLPPKKPITLKEASVPMNGR